MDLLVGGICIPETLFTIVTDIVIAIPNHAKAVRLASVDIYVAMKVFPNGTLINDDFMKPRTDPSLSRNCTKHNVRCPYMDMPVQEERQVTPDKPDLLWTPEIEAEIESWQQTGIFPFPDLYIYPAPAPQYFSFEDLRLIHHVASVSSELGNSDASHFTIWTRQMPL